MINLVSTLLGLGRSLMHRTVVVQACVVQWCERNQSQMQYLSSNSPFYIRKKQTNFKNWKSVSPYTYLVVPAAEIRDRETGLVSGQFLWFQSRQIFCETHETEVNPIVFLFTNFSSRLQYLPFKVAVLWGKSINSPNPFWSLCF